MARRRAVPMVVAGLTLAGFLGGAAVGAAPGPDLPQATRMLERRVRQDGLDGGVLLVGRDGAWGGTADGITAQTVMPIASASKWLTAALVMTYVDEGRLTLDTPVADVLPGFGGAKAAVTVRHLLSHTSGLTAPACVYAVSGSTASCAAAVGDGPAPVARPGRRFAYSGVGFEVAGRIVEVLSGRSFEAAFEDRIARPLGMQHTAFDVGGDGARIDHPLPSASATSSADDYMRFLAMLASDGVARTGPAAGSRLLTAAAVAAIESDQVRGIDTRDDGAVRTTGIPTYGLGVWRDLVSSDDEIRVVSGNGALGFYPWIDRRPASAGIFGVVAVADRVHGAEYAVPRSQRIARAAWTEAARAFRATVPTTGGGGAPGGASRTS